MKRIKLFLILAAWPSFFILFPFSAQGQFLIMEIKSEQKVLRSLDGDLNDIVRKAKSSMAFYLETVQVDALNKEFKEYAGRGLRNAKIDFFPRTYLRVYRNELDHKTYLHCIFSNQTLEFFITTPDKFLGIGADRKHDPYVKVTYNIVAEFPIEQNNTVESIKFGKPEWKKFEVTNFSTQRLDKRTDKIGTDFLKPWIENYLFNVTDYKNAFHRLDYLADEFNKFIQVSVKENVALLNELKLDENRQLAVFTEGEYKLVFQHFHSPTGMVKRSATKDPGVIMEGPKSTQQAPAPVTNSPAGVLEKNNSTKSPQINKGRVRQN